MTGSGKACIWDRCGIISWSFGTGLTAVKLPGAMPIADHENTLTGRHMQAAILTVGDELTCGYRLDTNSQAISRHLAAVPVGVVLHVSVGDDVGNIHEGLASTLAAAAVVIITGGLGPTEDDITRRVIAAHFDLDLVENPDALTRLQERFARSGRSMPRSNLIQAQVPSGSQIIHNDQGTASGFYLQLDSKHIFVTPGIPREMMGMLQRFILPRLRDLIGNGQHARRAALKVYGLPESGINERIQSMMGRDRNPLLGLLPHRGTITIEVVATGETAQEADRLIETDLARLRAELGKHIISEDERELPLVVGDLLSDRGLTVAVAELGTGGMVTVRLTEPKDAQRWFRSGMILSSEQDLEKLLGKTGWVDGEVALALADAARQRGHADMGIGVGPLILPEDGVPERPYGSIYVAVNLRGEETCRKIRVNGTRDRIREWAADAALALARRAVMECPLDSDGPRESGTGLVDWLWASPHHGDRVG